MTEIAAFGKGRCDRDALPHTFIIGGFQSVENNSTAIKHIYNESGNIIEGCNVAYDASIVTRARLRIHTRSLDTEHM